MSNFGDALHWLNARVSNIPTVVKNSANEVGSLQNFFKESYLFMCNKLINALSNMIST